MDCTVFIRDMRDISRTACSSGDMAGVPASWVEPEAPPCRAAETVWETMSRPETRGALAGRMGTPPLTLACTREAKLVRGASPAADEAVEVGMRGPVRPLMVDMESPGGTPPVREAGPRTIIAEAAPELRGDERPPSELCFRPWSTPGR